LAPSLKKGGNKNAEPIPLLQLLAADDGAANKKHSKKWGNIKQSDRNEHGKSVQANKKWWA